MKLLIESGNSSRSFNGGDYAKGYMVEATSEGCVVTVDRCFGSDFEGEYLHQYHLPCAAETGERIVAENTDVFAGMFAHKRVSELLDKYGSSMEHKNANK